MKPEIRAKLKLFHNSLKNEPIEPDDRCYVRHLEEVDGTGDPIKELFNRISYSESESVTLLSGNRGSGKSTELRRLRKLLEDDGCVVFLSDMRDYMNMTTQVEISDFFISIMGALNDAFFAKYNKNTAKENYWERLVNFLNNEVRIIDLNFKATEDHLRREMLPIAAEDMAWLKKIAESKEPELETISALLQLARFFDTGMILNYRNGADWYDVHPLLRELVRNAE